ncbi:MAG: calcium/sodium antiporter [Luteibaculaceae bacterium]
MVWLLLTVGLVLLLVGGDVLVKGAVKIANTLGFSPMVIGLTIVALGTSAPELVLSLDATLKGMPDYAIGNVIGSNIANLALVLGATSVILPTALVKRTLRIDWPILLGVTVVAIYMMKTDVFTVIDGIILVILLVAYNIFIFWQNRWQDRKDSVNRKPKEFNVKGFFVGIALFLIGLGALIWGSDLFLKSAEQLARLFGVSDHIIAVTIVAFGTSLPELVTSLVAAFKKEAEISIGNLIGSNIFNITCVLGITAIIKPIAVNPDVLQYDVWWMLGVVLLLFPMLLKGRQISRIEGLILLATYAAYVYFLLNSWSF